MNDSGGSPISSDDAYYGWEQATSNSFEVIQKQTVDPDGLVEFGNNCHPPGHLEFLSAYAVPPAYVLSGLTNVRPSRHRMVTPFELHLDDRINRLWGNYRTFASASSKGFGVTPLFGRTLSELFRQSRQIAENVSPRERS